MQKRKIFPKRFYYHFGSYYFSSQLQDSYFMFLVATGNIDVK